MSFEMKKVCMPSKGCKKRKGNGSAFVCLFVVFAFLASLEALVIIQMYE